MPKLLAALLCVMPLLGQAQIYKWVDARGVTHYTDNKYDAGAAPVVELRANAAPSPVLPTGVAWQQRDAEFRRLQQHKLMAPAYRPRPPRAQVEPHCLPPACSRMAEEVHNESHRTNRRDELGIDGAVLPPGE